MSEIRKVICDWCKADLTTSSNSVDWSIRLINRRITCNEGFVTDMILYPWFKSDMDFCHSGCLAKWLGRKDE